MDNLKDEARNGSNNAIGVWGRNSLTIKRSLAFGIIGGAIGTTMLLPTLFIFQKHTGWFVTLAAIGFVFIGFPVATTSGLVFHLTSVALPKLPIIIRAILSTAVLLLAYVFCVEILSDKLLRPFSERLLNYLGLGLFLGVCMVFTAYSSIHIYRRNYYPIAIVAFILVLWVGYLGRVSIDFFVRDSNEHWKTESRTIK